MTDPDYITRLHLDPAERARMLAIIDQELASPDCEHREWLEAVKAELEALDNT